MTIFLLAALGLWSLRERQFLLVDDAYISFRYAANLADGLGIVWNVGERVEGYTNLLWVLMLSAFVRFGVDLTWPAVFLSFAFAAGSLVLTVRISHLAGYKGLVRGSLAALLVASNGSFVNAATSGMESTAFGFLTLLAIYWLVRGRERGRLRFLSALCFSLACLTRPEGVLVTAVAVAVEFLDAPGAVPARLRNLATVAVPVALVVAAHMAVRLAYYGYALPNTFYAKVIFGPATLLRGIAHVSGFLLAGGFVTLPGLLELRRDGPLRPWLIHGYCLFGAYVLYLVVIGGDHPHWYRFYVPLLPLTCLGAAAWATRVAGKLALVATASVLGFAFGERREVIGRLSARDADVMLETTSFFRDEVPEQSFVAAAAVGHVGYYARSLHVLDMWGLNDAHIAHRDLPPSTKFGHDKYDLEYVAQMKPDYAYELLPVSPPPSIPGYDLCWPSRYPPVAVYRRSFALAPEEVNLGVNAPEHRKLGAPPPCRGP